MGRNAHAFGFLLGEWDIAMLTMPEGSTVGRRATLNVHRILDGAALLDEIRHVDDAGQVNFRGATFRTYLPDKDRWYVLWMMANIEGCTELEAQVIDGEVHTTGKGRDPWGALAERGRYYDISGDGFSFTLERSTMLERRGFDPSSRSEPLDANRRVTLANPALTLTALCAQVNAITLKALTARRQLISRVIKSSASPLFLATNQQSTE